MDCNISPSLSLESSFFHVACQANSYNRGGDWRIWALFFFAPGRCPRFGRPRREFAPAGDLLYCWCKKVGKEAPQHQPIWGEMVWCWSADMESGFDLLPQALGRRFLGALSHQPLNALAAFRGLPAIGGASPCLDKPPRKRRPRASGAESKPVHPPWSRIDLSLLK